MVAFLVAHGLLHLAIWVPKPEPDPDRPPPFEPDHSAVLTATKVPQAATHQLALALAAATTAAYLLTGIAVALDTSWAVAVAMVAAVAGLVLKGLYFHPWLSLGVLIDCAVLGSALVGWPEGLW